MTRRRVTLWDEVDGPWLWAECDDRGWNGYHVPTMTAGEFRGHIVECAAREQVPLDGEARLPRVLAAVWPVPFVDEAGALRLPAVDAPEEREYDTVWQPVGAVDGVPVYRLDGLVWTDPA